MAISITSGARALLLLTSCAMGATSARGEVVQGGPCSGLGEAGGAQSLATLRAGAGEAHGVREFDASGRLVIPQNISSIVVELWGAGGGGGAGSGDTISEGGAGGGGGASGAYRRAALAVVPGRTYTLIVGAGGPGGSGSGRPTAGRHGGDSTICDGDTLLVRASGGEGGQPATSNARGGTAGRARDTEFRAAATAILERPSREGTAGSAPLFEFRGRGGFGGRPAAGSTEPRGAFGGAGGAGAMTPERAGDGEAGGTGSVIVTW